jgi:hypothetical protein
MLLLPGKPPGGVTRRPALVAIELGQLPEAPVRAQGREVRTGIERGKIVETRVEYLLQCDESCRFIAANCIGRTEPEIVNARWAKTLS